MTVQHRTPVAPAPAAPGSSRRVSHVLRVGASAALVGTLLALVLPRVTGASWESALDAMTLVTPWQLAGLAALWLGGLWAYAHVLSGSLPGLSRGQGFVLNMVGSGVSNLVPFGGTLGVGVTWAMARQYGFSSRSVALYSIVTGIWDVVARLALPLIGLAALLVSGAHVGGTVLVASGIGAGLCAVVVGTVVATLVSDRVAAKVIVLLSHAVAWVAAAIRRPAPVGLQVTLRSQRENAVGLLRARGAVLVIGMVAYLFLQGLLMWACLAAVGSDLGWAEVTAGYTCGRLLTMLVLTPGGTGFAETGTAAVLVALGGDPAVTLAGVLLFSFFTFACEIPGAAVAYAWHLRARRWRRPRTPSPTVHRGPHRPGGPEPSAAAPVTAAGGGRHTAPELSPVW